MRRWLRVNRNIDRCARVAALSVWLAAPFGCGDQAPCGGYCGPGTICTADKCLPQPEDADAADAPDETPVTGKRKRRRKGRRGSDTDDGELPDDPRFDDSAVPTYRAPKTIDMKAGSERLDDHEIRQSLSKLEPKLNGCIEGAAARTDEEIGSGSVDFEIGIDPSGKVTGITARAPDNLRAGDLVKCLRKTIAAHRFRSYDGPPMGVDYTFDVR